MYENDPTSKHIDPILDLTPEVALRVFGPQSETADGTFQVSYDSVADARLVQERILRAQAEIAAENLAAAAEAKQEALDERQRVAAQKALTSKNAKKLSRKRTAKIAAAATAITALFVAPSVYEEFQDNTNPTYKTVANDVVSGSLSSIIFYIDKGASWGKNIKAWLNIESTSAQALPLPTPTNSPIPSETPTPEVSLTQTPTPTPTPTPTESPSKTSTLLPPLAFVKDYKTNKNGDIFGDSAVYKAKSGVTKEDVQRIENCGNNGNKFLFTFDDAASFDAMLEITDVLEKKQTGGIFFVNPGLQPKITDKQIKILRDKGFFVAEHSWNHKSMTSMSDYRIRNELKGNVANLFRPPYGATYKDKATKNIYFDDDVRRVVEGVGKRVCMWTVDTLDWKETTSKQDIVNTLKNYADKGGVALFHSRMKKTREGLSEYIDTVRAKGIETCGISKVPTSHDFNAVRVCED